MSERRIFIAFQEAKLERVFAKPSWENHLNTNFPSYSLAFAGYNKQAAEPTLEMKIDKSQTILLPGVKTRLQ